MEEQEGDGKGCGGGGGGREVGMPAAFKGAPCLDVFMTAAFKARQ